MARPVVHVEVRGLDSGLLQEFYSEVFGWERNEGLSIGDYAVAEIGAGNLTVGIGPVPDWSARSAKFYIQVDDIDETLTRIEAAGGRDVGAESGSVGTVDVTPEALVAAAPDVIVITSEGLEALGGIDGLLRIPGFAETPAGQARRILDYSEGDFLTFGPRIGESLAAFIADLRIALGS